jgi:segregation and condensation protein B
MEQNQIKQILEAALLASAHPLSVPQLAALFGENEAATHEDLARALEALGADCAGRGVELKEVASGFRYQVRQDVHPWVARLWTERQTRYSRALLETLSLIAYRQPITRGEIEQIRGVAVSTNIVKTLEEREWIRVVGYRDVPGKPELFGTTRHFLDYFNLKSLDELPPLAEIRDVEDFDVQMALAPVADGGENAADADGADMAPEENHPESRADGADPIESSEAAMSDASTAEQTT